MIAKVTRMHEFRRSMQGFFQNKWQHGWVVSCLILVAAGLVFSRALLSIASVLVAVPWFFGPAEKPSLKKPAIALLLLLLPVLVSGFWSQDKQEWWKTAETRIPLFTLLLGAYAVQLSPKEWKWVSAAYLASVTIGCVWSMGRYLADMQTMQASYLKAKVLPTLADHDYVRFSWMVALAVLLCLKHISFISSRTGRALLVVLMAGFVAYLHILAAKTGLLCLYAAALVYTAYLLCIRRNWKKSLLLLAIMVSVAVVAFVSSPTLRNRIQYVRYDFSLYTANGSAPGYNDAARWLSVKAGYGLLQQNPFTGVGFGDLRAATDAWHTRFHPQSLPYERFLPACEWLVYGAASGWPGMLLFSAGLVLLLYATTGRNVLSAALLVVTVIPIVFDDTLEGQLGTAILAFIVFFAQTIPVPPGKK
ncbi:O-antigen ligase family protein [Sediminibacterium soli]|uniref:O-antigen ligase family protein n=1 Tax=Sediminibacterium soli TaxID=2698829 RepID=UPI00137AF559|nr:O-antigen ligase family protein [Sediminibacterium soli]NCI47727.1 hypothetical protein [Sediminibacterium soli]